MVRASPKAEKFPWEGRLKAPDATFTATAFGKLNYPLTIDLKSKAEKIQDVGFETQGPSEFKRVVSKVGDLFLAKTSSEAETISLDQLFQKIEHAPEERAMIQYAWTVFQDTVSRLPSSDPLSKAIGKISKLHDEFPLGDMGADAED